MAMVWIALLGGGDYAPEGLPGFGNSIYNPDLNCLADLQARQSPMPSRTQDWPLSYTLTNLGHVSTQRMRHAYMPG